MLKAIAPADFVAAFVAQNAEGRKDILLTLAARYDDLHVAPALAIERPWLRDVYDKLIAYINGLDPVPRAALKVRVEHYLEKVIPTPEVAVAGAPLVSASATSASAPE